MGKYYAVRSGRNNGVYGDWDSCRKQVDGYSGAKFKSFKTLDEANNFISGGDANSSGGCRSGGYSSGGYSSGGYSSGGYSSGGYSSGGYSSGGYSNASHNSSTNNNHSYGNSGHSNNRSTNNNYSSSYHHPFDNSTNSNGYGGKVKENIYCDGSSLGNGMGGALAGYGVHFESGLHKDISNPLKQGAQTNNRAELKAVHAALDVIHDDIRKNNNNNKEYNIHTDSEYVSKLLNERHQNYSDSKMKSMANPDLVIPLVNKYKQVKEAGDINVNWVRGHNGTIGNEIADKLAREGANKS
ncbi:RNA-DNA hybrid ribonuclease SCDLUD_003128 [Saccharomycodes ludwigii]|uniref:RNA-DNA hybrid ribonuclease n=1 Tax=Saccharomycodes ludwigii TaxID=36035 RepID=UPI001E83FE16|nr:hypothetical protein SCDLUD_003128 [Saccharomycodes ludwigii]KAH3900158.1 hypothetical protein SCDLUD_003128 [Saccharomycodes ludwigii]